jgi:hypothetical protein
MKTRQTTQCCGKLRRIHPIAEKFFVRAACAETPLIPHVGEDVIGLLSADSVECFLLHNPIVCSYHEGELVVVTGQRNLLIARALVSPTTRISVSVLENPTEEELAAAVLTEYLVGDRWAHARAINARELRRRRRVLGSVARDLRVANGH